MIRLTIGQIKQLHKLLISETGGSHGTRDENLLESAINAPFQTFDKIYISPTIEVKPLDFALVLL